MSTPASALPALWGARPVHRPVLAMTTLMAVGSVVCLVLLVLDPSEVLGARRWAKPLKFQLSFVLYGLTLAWLLAMLPPRRVVWWSATVIAVASVVEVVLITAMAGLGRRSHFDMSTPLNQAVWMAMGTTIVVLWVMTLMVAVSTLGVRVDDPARRLAVRAGLVVALLGMALGFLMTVPTTAQLADPQGIVGAHAVGAPEDGPGLPFLGWSTVGGDLRIPHFLGMHALQLFPAVVIGLELLALPRPALRSSWRRQQVVTMAVVGWTGLVALVTWQALRGQSVVAPDVWTLVGAAGLVLVLVLLAVRAARTSRAEPVAGPEPDAVVPAVRRPEPGGVPGPGRAE